MELDLQRFYNINRRVLMWLAFGAILFLLRDFFAVMFMIFIFGFVMRKVAVFLTGHTRVPYRYAVIGPYLVAIALLALLMVYAIPRVTEEGMKFSKDLPRHLEELSESAIKTARKSGWEPVLAKYVNPPDKLIPEGDEESESTAADTQPGERMATQAAESPPGATATRPATRPAPVHLTISTEALVDKLQEIILSLIPPAYGENPREALPNMIRAFVVGVVGGTLQFLLAILLSFLIVLDFDRINHELTTWRASPVGRFFHEAAASVIDFSGVVGTAFQCQLMVATLNAAITCVGMVVLGIEPLLLLTTIVFLFGLIPVLGVFISSVPIILIAFNTGGITLAMLALGIIVVVHMLEAYVFNPRIYAARFHLNPVIVLIILLVAHELFGVWGMLLCIPVTHYVLNIAQMPSLPRRESRSSERRGKKQAHLKLQ